MNPSLYMHKFQKKLSFTYLHSYITYSIRDYKKGDQIKLHDWKDFVKSSIEAANIFNKISKSFFWHFFDNLNPGTFFQIFHMFMQYAWYPLPDNWLKDTLHNTGNPRLLGIWLMESSQIFHLYYSSISSIIMIFRPILSGFRFLGSFLDPDIPIVEDPLYCLFKFFDEKSFN